MPKAADPDFLHDTPCVGALRSMPPNTERKVLSRQICASQAMIVEHEEVETETMTFSVVAESGREKTGRVYAIKGVVQASIAGCCSVMWSSMR